MSGGPALLERAALYALATLGAVGGHDLAIPTPCTAWDLRTLLDHLGDSIDVFTGLVVTNRMAVTAAHRVEDDPVTAVRCRAVCLIGACTSAGHADAPCEIGDRILLAGTAAGIGAIELTVHGWDVARACGVQRPVPDSLARTLWELAAVVVPADARCPEFGVPVAVEPPSSASDRLIAYLGRRP